MTAEEEALYDMDDDQFEEALAAARAEQDQGDVGDDVGNTDETGGDGASDGDIADDATTPGSDTTDGKVNDDQDGTGDDAGNTDDADKTSTGDADKDGKDKNLEQSTTDSKTDGEKNTGDNPAKADAYKTDADDADKSEPGDKKPQTLKYKANGQEFEFTEKEVLERFGQVFGQSMNYTQKMQEIKPWRTTISALEDNKMSHEDVELMIDVMKGDKGAINKLMERTGVNPMELDAEDEDQAYQPQQYGQSDVELEINDIVNEIGRDPEYAITQNVLSNQWDQESRNAFLENPSLIKKLHIDVKSGDFNVLSAEATKLKLYDGNRLSDIEYYAQAAQNRSRVEQSRGNDEAQRAATEKARLEGVNAEAARQTEANATRVAEVKAQQEKQRQVEADAQGRRDAAISSKASGTKTVVDYLDDDDASFDDWYKKLEASI